MADEQDAEETIHQKNSIADHNLDLSLALRPLNSPPFSNDVLHPNNVLHNSNQLLFKSNAQIMSNREQQAIRRREAKVKRDLKRKAASFSAAQNDVVIQAKFSKRRLWGNAGGLYKEHNGNFGDGENRSSVSSGSSSGVSDNYYSNSTAGGNSSDTSSHSSHPHIHAPAANVPTPSSALNQPAASPQQEHTPLNSINHNLPQPQLYSSSSNHTHLITNSNQLSKSQTKEAKVDIGKPPKPSGQMTSHQSSRLPQMPCVTTTGNGPKGKTITGFLYKYTKTEVSIVCICHGESFSPAGFVEHAGGVDIENPLKHIRVAPFPLG